MQRVFVEVYSASNYDLVGCRLLSMFGVCLCLALMIMSSWYYTIAALLLAAGLYKYIEYKGFVLASLSPLIASRFRL